MTNFKKNDVISFRDAEQNNQYGKFINEAKDGKITVQTLGGKKKTITREDINDSTLKLLNNKPAKKLETDLPKVDSKALKDVLKNIKDSAIFKSFSDTLFYNMFLRAEDENGNEVVNMNWVCTTNEPGTAPSELVDFKTVLRENETSVTLTILRPFSKVFTFVKNVETGLIDCETLTKELETLTQNVYDELLANYTAFSIQYKYLCSSYKDGVFDFFDKLNEEQNEAEKALENPQQEEENTSFRLTKETKTVNGIKVFRIEALTELPKFKIKIGDKGGFIERVSNLDNYSWVADNAVVMNQAKVTRGAFVGGSAKVLDRVVLGSGCSITGEAEIGGSCKLINTFATDTAKINGIVSVISNRAKLVISGKAKLFGKVVIGAGKTSLHNTAIVQGIDTGLHISDTSFLDETEIEASGNVGENILIIGKSKFSGNIDISSKGISNTQYTFKDIISSGNFICNTEVFKGIDKRVITPEDLGDIDLIGNTVIKSANDLLKTINENQEKSVIDYSSNLFKYKVFAPKAWFGPAVSKDLTSKQKEYIKYLNIRMIEDLTTPEDVRKDSEQEEVVFDVNGKYMFYGKFNGEALDYIIKLDTKLFK